LKKGKSREKVRLGRSQILIERGRCEGGPTPKQGHNRSTSPAKKGKRHCGIGLAKGGATEEESLTKERRNLIKKGWDKAPNPSAKKKEGEAQGKGGKTKK